MISEGGPIIIWIAKGVKPSDDGRKVETAMSGLQVSSAKIACIDRVCRLRVAVRFQKKVRIMGQSEEWLVREDSASADDRGASLDWIANMIPDGV